MNQKVVLITGTSTGLGLETAKIFALNGYKVYASMRNLQKKEQLMKRASEVGVRLQLLELDVCKTESITQAVNDIIDKENKIDLLINNAGAGFAKTTEHASEDEIQWVMETNYLSVVRCTKAVLPYMRKQKSGHIINISSVGGLVGQPFNELYCAAKFAVEGYTEALACYLGKPFNISFTAVEPGGIATEFGKSATAKTLGGAGLPNDEYMPILQQYIDERTKRAESGDTSSFQTAAQVADIIWEVSQSEKPPIRIRTSDWAENLCRHKTQSDPTGTIQNAEVRKEFLGQE